jgi:hypothetical protein
MSENGATPLAALPLEDADVCDALSDWLQHTAGVVPSKCDMIAALLVSDGQSSTKRVANSIRKDRDYLLALGLDESDSDEIVDALAAAYPAIITGSSRGSNGRSE